MGRGASAFFNLITLIFVTLTAVTGIVALAVAGDALDAPFWAVEEETAPTSTLLADVYSQTPPATATNTSTPTETPSPTLTVTNTSTATFTPSVTNTPTDTPTVTYTPSVTHTFTPVPTDTPIPPTNTPTATLTFTPSPTPTFTPSPTGPSPTPTHTLSPFPFIVQQGTPLLRDNFLNGAGCNWQGFAGQVITEQAEAVVGVQIRVSGDDIGELYTISGTNSIYGPSGWEMGVSNVPNNGRYRVQLVSGTVELSPVVEVVFPNSCQQNLALINFVQTRPF